MKAIAIYPRLKRFVVIDILKERGRDLRAIVLFGKLVIMWEAPESEGKQ